VWRACFVDSSRGGTRTPDRVINRHLHRPREGSLSEDDGFYSGSKKAAFQTPSATDSATGRMAFPADRILADVRADAKRRDRAELLRAAALIAVSALAATSLCIVIPGALVMWWVS
jgi:hypothetical protein